MAIVRKKLLNRPERSKKPDVIDLEIIKALYVKFVANEQQKLGEFIIFSANCPLRVSKILALKFSDILEKEHNGKLINYIEIKEDVPFVLNSAALRAVNNLRMLKPDAIFLFERNSEVKAISRQFVSKQLALMGDSLRGAYKQRYFINPESLRKTFAHYCWAHEVHPKLLLSWFGHSTITEFEKFAGIDEYARRDRRNKDIEKEEALKNNKENKRTEPSVSYQHRWVREENK